MLRLHISDSEIFNEKTNSFEYINSEDLMLEHSLISISKWESLWKKPYLVDTAKTDDEFLSYIQCMTINSVRNEKIYYSLNMSQKQQIINYINDSMTATWFSKRSNNPPGSREIVTSEVIYYWMIKAAVPFECEKWHLNRLLTLLRVCGAKDSKGSKKMSRKEIYSQNAALNAMRRKQLNTLG